MSRDDLRDAARDRLAFSIRSGRLPARPQPVAIARIADMIRVHDATKLMGEPE
jgi:hypothetical protein